MIIAGDSAGGGLVLALLQILRDTEGLELPAGAVLISPVRPLSARHGLADSYAYTLVVGSDALFP